ncbi:6-carboxy-5,6,7,8-tetrahydropterin synthase [Porphyridium purpureum]|uniref:6-pyruvoyltetrahydropterin synthase n=1 Tax=Porphyridium purpureum TaxID=35688 RepID=A0A5J4YWJ8_PORPP|nr:6-carboxy-5,6,7,8-tetrahydropterin synthase [Porphyridium purpureum]|eukprot:POR1708..scf227_4
MAGAAAECESVEVWAEDGVEDEWFELEKEFRFEAMHVLLHHDGKCARPHGHSYGLRVALCSHTLVQNGPKVNMLMDFSDISAVCKKMLDAYLDHHNLNETLQTDSPTAEFIAKWVFHYLEPKLPLLHSVTVSETHTSRATYRRRRSSSGQALSAAVPRYGNGHVASEQDASRHRPKVLEQGPAHSRTCETCGCSCRI